MHESAFFYHAIKPWLGRIHSFGRSEVQSWVARESTHTLYMGMVVSVDQLRRVASI